MIEILENSQYANHPKYFDHYDLRKFIQVAWFNIPCRAVASAGFVCFGLYFEAP